MEKSRMRQISTVSLGRHGRTLLHMITAPGKFFESRRDQLIPAAAGTFLLISATLFTALSLAFQRSRMPLVTGAILLGNALGMVMILSFISYLVMVLSMGRKTSYGRIFSIFAYASGTSLMAAWIPHLLVVSEPWRWVLIGIGLTKGCGIRWMGSIWIIICSVTIMTILFRSVLPLVQA
ncbi:MAG: hypothetical protein C4522_10550 [Desulfobacteraceae bacterium]|nr:MAG: hypothetical protein C4522_10550 [Desulfobacteraceae bacterium]